MPKNFECSLMMLSLWSLSSVALLIYAFDVSNTLDFVPTRTWGSQRSSALAGDDQPTPTAETFHGDLKARVTNAQNPTCGWIDGNGGKRLCLDVSSLRLTFHFEL